MYLEGLYNSYDRYQSDKTRFIHNAKKELQRILDSDDINIKVDILENSNVNDYLVRVSIDDVTLSFEQILDFEGSNHCRLVPDIEDDGYYFVSMMI